MKKTIITLLALAGVSQSATVITVAGTSGGTTLPTFSTDAVLWDNTPLADKDTLIYTTQLGDVISASWETGGFIWGNQASSGTWANQDALTEMNSILGTSITLENINSLNFAAPGWPKSMTVTITLNSSIEAGTKIAFYTLATATNAALGNLTITGIDNARYSYATDTASGFSKTAAFSDGATDWTLVKVEGTLAEGASGASPVITVSSTTSKNGFGMFAYAVPEPTTATLSLLALAGLVARRRRR